MRQVSQSKERKQPKNKPFTYSTVKPLSAFKLSLDNTSQKREGRSEISSAQHKLFKSGQVPKHSSYPLHSKGKKGSSKQSSYELVEIILKQQFKVRREDEVIKIILKTSQFCVTGEEVSILKENVLLFHLKVSQIQVSDIAECIIITFSTGDRTYVDLNKVNICWVKNFKRRPITDIEYGSADFEQSRKSPSSLQLFKRNFEKCLIDLERLNLNAIDAANQLKIAQIKLNKAAKRNNKADQQLKRALEVKDRAEKLYNEEIQRYDLLEE